MRSKENIDMSDPDTVTDKSRNIGHVPPVSATIPEAPQKKGKESIKSRESLQSAEQSGMMAETGSGLEKARQNPRVTPLIQDAPPQIKIFPERTPAEIIESSKEFPKLGRPLQPMADHRNREHQYSWEYIPGQGKKSVKHWEDPPRSPMLPKRIKNGVFELKNFVSSARDTERDPVVKCIEDSDTIEVDTSNEECVEIPADSIKRVYYCIDNDAGSFIFEPKDKACEMIVFHLKAGQDGVKTFLEFRSILEHRICAVFVDQEDR